MSVFIKDFNDFKHLCSYQVSGYCGKDTDIEVRCNENICPYSKATFKYDNSKRYFVDVNYLMNIIANEDESFGYVCAYDIEHAPMIEEKRGNWMNLRTYTDEYENKVSDFMCSNCCNVIRGVPENYKNMPKFCHECGAKMMEVVSNEIN